jgi:hypothetical protein
MTLKSPARSFKSPLFVSLVASALALAACSSSGDAVGEGDCVDGNCSGGSLFDPGVNNSEQGACAQVDVTMSQATPYVMLLVDQSGSMTSDFGNGTRWDVLREALLDPGTGIVRQVEDDMRLGLALYTSFDGHDGGACPIINQISTEFGNYDAIKAAYDGASPEEDTPTGESIDAVAQQLFKIKTSEPTPKVIVLATDGEPDTCDQPDPQNGQQRSLEAAQNAFGMGITTYVISVGDEVGLPHLQDMANAGAGLAVGGDQNAKFYQALDQDQLFDAFQTILDGNVLAKDDADGWRLNGSKELQLVGAACEMIQEGDHAVAADFPCGGYTPPPTK